MICMAYFPMVIKTSHLRDLREFIRHKMGTTSFEESFFRFSSGGQSMYSQFNIMCTYLWHHKHNEYQWYMHDSCPWWDGLDDPPPAPGQAANKTAIFTRSFTKDTYASAIVPNNPSPHNIIDEYFQPRPYISNHLFSRNIKLHLLDNLVNSKLEEGLCWALKVPGAKVMAAPQMSTVNVQLYHEISRVLPLYQNPISTPTPHPPSSTAPNLCSKHYTKGYHKEMHVFEESSDVMMYGESILTKVQEIRRKRLVNCPHTYIFI